MALFSKYHLSFLATEILEEIIELLLRKTLFQCIELKSQCMELLITPSLRRLNLYNWSPDDAAQVSIHHLISVRCTVSFAMSSISLACLCILLTIYRNFKFYNGHLVMRIH